MLLQLAVFNSSNYPYKRLVTTEWEPIYQKIREKIGEKISPKQILLYDSRDDSQLLCQVDLDNPDDPSQGKLLFLLNQDVTSELGSPVLVNVNYQDKPRVIDQSEPSLEMMWGPDNSVRGIRLTNSRLITWLNLIPTPDPTQKNKDFFAGAATSVQLYGKESLDPFLAELSCMGHDPEKRCMQIDGIQLYKPKSNSKLGKQFNPIKKHYEFIAKSVGPLRANVTIASEPFPCNLDSQKFRLYRTFSLFAGADYLIEELSIENVDNDFNTKLIQPYFRVDYYTHINLRYEEIPYRGSQNYWSAAFSPVSPKPGYAFISSVPHELVQQGEHRFSWQLSDPCKSLKCLHLFMHGSSGGPDAWMKDYFYRYIDKGLEAKIYQENQQPDTPPELIKI